jgi:hypothetical protein
MLLLGLTSQETQRYSVEEPLGPPRSLPVRSLTDKTIILDMDLTLICTIGDGSDLSQRMRINHQAAYNSLLNKGILVPTTLTQFGGSGKAMHNDVIKRPGIDEFLFFCKYVFKHVILWSAGQASYVYDIVKLVIDPQDCGIFDHIYTAQDIVHSSVDENTEGFGASLRSAGYTTFSTKPIEFISEKFPDVTLDNSIIVDDLPCNFMPNPHNGVLIPAFSPQLNQLLSAAKNGVLENICDDYCLFSLLHYLADDEFLKSADVRKYNLDFFKDSQELV